MIYLFKSNIGSFFVKVLDEEKEEDKRELEKWKKYHTYTFGETLKEALFKKPEWILIMHRGYDISTYVVDDLEDQLIELPAIISNFVENYNDLCI
jgi:hypothetical protein